MFAYFKGILASKKEGSIIVETGGVGYLINYPAGLMDALPGRGEDVTVYTYTSATFEKKKKKEYNTLFGCFTYRDVPSLAYPYGILIKKENEYYFQIASPEKALCDLLYTISPVGSLKEMRKLLWEDLRMESSAVFNLNASEVEHLSGLYHSTNVILLSKLLRRRA